VTLREEHVLQSMYIICEEAKELFKLHPGLREFKIVRLEDGEAQVNMSEEDDLILFGSPPWGKSEQRSRGTHSPPRASDKPDSSALDDSQLSDATNNQSRSARSIFKPSEWRR
jgi:hypothetical protein